MTNISKLWIDGDLDIKQRITRLTTPSGFFFGTLLSNPAKSFIFQSFLRRKKPWGMRASPA